MLEFGSVLEDRYRVEKKIGEGSSGTVYKAIQIRTGRLLAVKEIGRISGDASVARRLRLLKDLHHSGLPMILDVLETDKSFLIVMEYISGKNLQEELDHRVAENRCFSTKEVYAIGIGLCEILSYLHTLPEPLLYRDIKPSNIVIRTDGIISLVDMGTICVYRGRNIGPIASMGTTGYAAPEQYTNEPEQGPETDIYSVGVVLYHLLTGINPAKKPFSFEKITKNGGKWSAKGKREEERQTFLLEQIIGRCTRFRREERFQTAQELLAALKNPERYLHEKKKDEKYRMLCPLLLIILALGAFGICRKTDQMIQAVRQEGKEYCLMKAQRSEQEKTDEWIQYALQFSPGDGSCFSVLLDRMLSDGIFSFSEQTRVRTLLDQKADGEDLDHETLLQKDAETYFRFSYRMGTAFLYASEGIPDYIAARDWFGDVESAGKQWNPDAEGKQTEKELLLKRTEILERICIYREQILSGNIRAEQPASLREHWENLTVLLEEDIPAGNLLVTELGLWREILGLLSDWPSELKKAGVTWDIQKESEEKIKFLVSTLQNSRETEEYPIVKEELEELEKTVDQVEKKRLVLEEAENREKRKEQRVGN